MESTILPDWAPDAVSVMEVPPSEVSTKARRAAELALLAAELALPPPGPPPALRVRFHVPYERWLADIYEEVQPGTEPFLVGQRWQGHFAADVPGEVWIRYGQHPQAIASAVLHELTHAWRERTAQARSMSNAAKEDEAVRWAEYMLPKVVAAAQAEPGGLSDDEYYG